MYTIRSGIFSFGYTLVTIVYGTLSPLLFAVPTRMRHKVIISWTCCIVWWVKIVFGIKYRVEGGNFCKNLDEPVVVLSKHQSTWETFFLQAQFWPASTILKKELLKIPFFGWGLRALNPIAIDRSNPRAALKQVKEGAAKRLNEGYHLIMFPEGTRTAPGERQKYARSGADIAIASGKNIVPVAHNAGEYWPVHGGRKKAGTICVHIGEPISPEGKTSKQLISEVESWIETKMQLMLNDTGKHVTEKI